MQDKKEIEVVLRPKRQITLPREVCDQLNVGPGDLLELTVEGTSFVARPRKVKALDALREITEAFERSGITEGELLEAGRQTRRKLNRERNVTKT